MLDTGNISVSNVALVLRDEWGRWKCMKRLKDVIDVIITEYGFDINAVEHGDTVLNKMCCSCIRLTCNDAKNFIPHAITSLVEAGARPELKSREDLLTQFIRHYSPARAETHMAWGSVIDFVTTLLKHGAKLNTILRWPYKEDSNEVELESDALDHVLHYRDSWEFDHQLIVLLLVHGACLKIIHVGIILLELAWLRHDGQHTRPLTEKYKRLLRYMRCAGSKFHFSLENHRWIEDIMEFTVYKEVMEHKRMLETQPGSLQFQCRRVIRQQMSIAADGKSILDGIDDLPLPAMLRDYLKLKDAE